MSTESGEENEINPAELLIEAQNADKYLFHGSSKELAVLEPRQAKGDISNKDFNKTESVYATSSATRAVVSAIMPKGKGVGWGTLQDNEGNVTIRCNQEVFDQIKPGLVYILGHKEKAEKDEDGPSHQFKYNEAQEPLLVVPVNFEDFQRLGGKVEIIE